MREKREMRFSKEDILRKIFQVAGLLLLIGIAEQAELYSQEHHAFEHLSTSDGLSDGNVSSMLKDRKGFMWFGTWDGLNRFDGQNFTVYKYNGEEGVAVTNRIASLLEDANGNLWITIVGGKVLRFDTRHLKFDAIPGTNYDSIDSRIKRVALMPSGDVWLLLQDRGAFRVYTDTISNKFRVEYIRDFDKNDQILTVNDVVEDFENNIWICTEKGLKRLKHNGSNQLINSDFLKGVEKQLNTESIVASHMINNEQLLLGTSSGKVFSLNTKTADLEVLLSENKYPVSNIVSQ